LAILQLSYQEEATDKSGTKAEYSGRWTATATREAGDWRFLAWAWLQMEPWPFGDIDGAAERAAVRQVDHDMVAAANAHDLDAWLAFVADDAQFLPPGSPPVVGKEALGDLVTEFMAADVLVKHDLEDVVVSKGGDLAYVSYAYEFTVTGPEGTRTTETGRDISIYKKDADGSWKLAVDIWN
jgi:uncharacterized protein (TIGR02246 family)